MRQMKNGIYCYLIADILVKVSEMFVEWSSTKHIFFPNPSFSLVVMATERLNVLKLFEKINSSEAIRVIKLNLFRNVHSISLYKNVVFYCRCLCTLVAMAA